MAKERMINTKFWDDSYIVTLDPIEKLLYLYFLTNPLTNICGIYEIQLRRVAFDTGIDKDMVQKIIDRFMVDKKIYYIQGWLAIKNFAKHQRDNPKVKKGIEIALKEVPKIVIDSLSIDYDSLSHSNSNSNSNSNLNSNTNTKIAPTKVVAVDTKPLKAKREPKPIVQFSKDDLEQRLQQMESVEGSALDIIATYIRQKPVNIENSKQLSLVIGRFIRIARASEGAYTNEQIFNAIDELKFENENKKRRGEPEIDWTVETIIKKLIKK